MKTQVSIFASRSERTNYYKLLQRWGDKYRVHQNIPFLRVFDVKSSEITNSRTYEYLKKTSIDYVLCDTDDKPLLGVEYDGIQQGISIGTTYEPKKGFEKSRTWGIESKLGIAHQCNFPLVVVSDTEFNYLAGTGLMIIDGLIGMILSRQAFKREFQDRNFEKFMLDRYEITPEQFEHLPHRDQQEYVDSFGIDVEVDTEMENNPIVRKRWKIQHILGNMTARTEGTTIRWTLGWKESHLLLTDNKRFIGTKFEYFQGERSVVEKTVILPKFNLPQVVYVGGLATEIAALLAAYELARLWGVDISKIE